MYIDGVKEDHTEKSKYPGNAFGIIFGGSIGTNVIIGNEKELYAYNELHVYNGSNSKWKWGTTQ